MFALLKKQFPIDNRPPVAPDVHISYGQSWRSNSFPSFTAFGLNPQPQTLLACKVNTLGQGLPAGPMPNSAGISLTGTIIGLTGYQGSDVFAIGRCAVAALQLWRLYNGATVLRPCLEFCAAYPASTWQTGLGGGLSPGAVFTASVTNGSMVVTAVASRMLSQGQMVTGTGVPANAYILGGANPGTTGTYRVAVATTVLANTQMQTSGGAVFSGGIGGAAGNDTLTVQIMISGTINVGDQIISGVPSGSPPISIFATITGSGGTGTYQILIGATQINLASATYHSLGVSWNNQATILASIQSVLPMSVQAIVDGELAASVGVETGDALPDEPDVDALDPEIRDVARANALHVDPDPDVVMAFRDIVARHAPRTGFLNAVFRSVGYTQGGSADGTDTGKVADLTDMVQLYDAMALPGTGTTPLHYYFCLPAGVSNSQIYSATNFGTVEFCRTHAPGQGGAFSGRVFYSACSYPWLFNGADNIHTGDYGTSRWGEWEGYVKHLVEDQGILWTPLWRPLTGGTISRSGQVLTVPFARPAGPDFASTPMTWQSNRDDGVKVWPQNGFHVRRGGADLTATPTISGMNVLLTITQTITTGDSLEVSYAWYGPGGPNPGTDPGMGGNLVMNGPPSVMYPNGWNGVAKTLDAWAVPFIETVTA